MINFRDNFFFAKFTVLFFILTIFGYWGIDLNSEELYIAFSFFLLVIAGVVLSRHSILLVFSKSVNTKYFRIVSDLLIVVGALTMRRHRVRSLWFSSVRLELMLIRFNRFVSFFLKNDSATVDALLKVRKLLLSGLLSISFASFVKNVAQIKKFYSFSGTTTKLFSVKI